MTYSNMTDKVAMSCEFLSPPWLIKCSRHPSTELDAEKRLALQEEKQALEAKLLDV